MNTHEAIKIVENGIMALNDALQAGQSETLMRFLSTLARFHNYSLRNALLIYLQQPDATHVAGFHTWKKLGRFVKKGEAGIAILAPMVSRKAKELPIEERDDVLGLIYGFKVVHVFDVSQTDGKALPQFAKPHGDPMDWLGLLEEVIRSAGITLDYSHISGGALGRSAKGKITVRPDLPPNETFAVLAHELAHELLHQQLDRRATTTRTIRETEAEAVAHTVCLACGIDSTARSADYIRLYQGNWETLTESLGLVQDSASDILVRLHAQREQREAAAATAMPI